MLRVSMFVLWLSVISLLGGCDNGYQDIDAGEPVSQQEQAEPQEQASPAGMNQRTGGRPSLGKARNAAENTLDQLKAHDRDIQREIDRQNEN